MPLSFFTRDPDAGTYLPTDVARSLWSGGQLHGVAVSGLLAQSLEAAVAELGRQDVRPARYTVDLFRPAAMQPCVTRTEVVRESRRLCLVDAVVEQGGVPVARASALFLKATEPAPGEVWEPEGSPGLPPEHLAPETGRPRPPLFASEGIGWSDSFADHQNADRKTAWQTGLPVVAGEPLTGFVAAASIADAGSMVTNWGTRGIEHINTDITLTLARQPVGVEIGLSALDRVSSDGIAVGTVTVFDRSGRLGTGVVTSLANTAQGIDFAERDVSRDPRHRSA